jgi:hypothetical protein
MAVTFLVALFYCLDALYGERRDRSILFWKSLPVSDITTVLSKASIPVVVVPLSAFALTVATHLVMLVAEQRGNPGKRRHGWNALDPCRCFISGMCCSFTW